MQHSIHKCALACCATIMVSGCAMQQNAAPEYRLSSSTQEAVPGASMLQRGRAQLDAGLNALAIEAFRAEIRSNPDSADAYNGLAVAYGRIGRDDLAQRYFETALAKDPGNGKAQSNLARLTGDAAPQMQTAGAIVPAFDSEPVAVVGAVPADPIGQLVDSLATPALAASIMVQQIDEQAALPAYTLAKQGVLSSRFAVAPASFVTLSGPTMVPSKPDRLPPLPEPSVPTGYLTSDTRAAGTRLVRVSLGEVHLVTRPQLPVKPFKNQAEFKSFGDRLKIWLPQSIAMEHARAGTGTGEAAVLMAAIERAQDSQKLAAAGDITLPEIPEFAYLSFDTAEFAANV